MDKLNLDEPQLMGEIYEDYKQKQLARTASNQNSKDKIQANDEQDKLQTEKQKQLIAERKNLYERFKYM